MKNKSNKILILVFLVGLSLLLYPILSDLWNSRVQSKAIATYEESVSKMTQEDYTAYWEAANEYNKRLLTKTNRYYLSESDKKEYENILSTDDTGIMGYVEIPVINVSLPIYHGISDEVLQVAIGHIEGTSLPVGGPSTHCAISGHRGLPSAKLFTNLDKMEEGDIFLIHTLDDVLAYQVDRILIVEPEDVSGLEIEENKDYCTLITCTPYGINSHRLLVRGERIEYNENTIEQLVFKGDANHIEPIKVAPVIAVPILVILFIWLLWSTRDKNNKSNKVSNKETSRRRRNRKGGK
ncbi:class C sortase [Tyzzerella sp. An114]|uniref:class C sortase n=1 Tax=Tyzzerella sp. An114 TaxID=1965545 RepID=UPI000B55B5B1|nr:class C sortase [Tyzzerella sp. An114]OUQ59505.1 class C sortase [Tyzzerella sp. An114]HIT73452.1 class C sortase [Candidatus Fimicola cottocaccae]